MPPATLCSSATLEQGSINIVRSDAVRPELRLLAILSAQVTFRGAG